MNSELFSVFPCIVFFTVFFANQVYGAGLPKDGPCTTLGPVCSADCSQVLLCVLEGENPIPTETCGIDPASGNQQYCDDFTTQNTAVCADGGKPNCNAAKGGGSARCAEFGEFPDPMNCGATNKCSEDASQKLTLLPGKSCGVGEFINVLKPGLPCEKGTCPRQPVECTQPGTGGSIQSNSVYCYTCGKEGDTNTIFVHYCPSKKNWNFWSLINGHNNS